MERSIATLSGAFGRYRPIADLGHGGMARVYLAAASGPGGFTKLVVIKELKNDLAEDPEFMTMFLDEAKLAARLSHPNIVQTFEVEANNGRHAIVMEYLDGQPLSRVRGKMAELGPRGVAVQLRAILDSLAGLHHAHELRDFDGTPLHVVHRDVSPHNVFVTYAGQGKVVDFGIAKAIDSSAQTRTGVIKGKLAYMAPEQAMSQPCDRRADVFAVGVMIWEAVAGQRLWKGLEEFGILHKLSTGAIPRVRDVKPDADPEIDAICARALAPSRDDRYPTAEALREDLEQYVVAKGLKLSAQQVGAELTRVFSEDRRIISSKIEEQLRAMRQEGSQAELPLPQLGPQDAGAPGASTVSHAAMVTPPQGTPASPKRALLPWALAFGVAVGAGALLAVGLVATRKAASPAPATSVVSAPPSVSGAAKPKTIHVAISAKPEGATITIDGARVTGQLDVEQDSATHTLVVEAPGFAPYTSALRYDRDQAIPVILERARPQTTTTKPRPTGPKPQGSDDELGF